MAGRSTLADALRAHPSAAAPPAAEPPSAPPSAPAPTSDHRSYRAPSRVGRKAVTFYFDPAAHRQLRILALELDRPLQDVAVEAFNDLLQKYRKPRIVD